MFLLARRKRLFSKFPSNKMSDQPKIKTSEQRWLTASGIPREDTVRVWKFLSCMKAHGCVHLCMCVCEACVCEACVCEVKDRACVSLEDSRGYYKTRFTPGLAKTIYRAGPARGLSV